jgi:site-specific recombinase XerD
MAFVGFRGWTWPQDSAQLLRVSILDVQAFKDNMGKHGGAPKTINRRISSLSSFYKFLAGAAAGVPIESVQDLLDHKHNTTTQIYDKQRRSVRDSASHKVPI